MRKKMIIIIGLIILIVTGIILLVVDRKKNLNDVEYSCNIKGNTSDYDVTEELIVYRKNNVVFQMNVLKVKYYNNEAYANDKNSSKDDKEKEFNDDTLTISTKGHIEKIDKNIDKYIKSLNKQGYKCTIK